MDCYYDNIEDASLRNDDYRRVVYTDDNIQIVLMSIEAGDEIGLEKHPGVTQFFRIEKGVGIAKVGKIEYAISDGSAIAVPPNTLHNIINLSSKSMKLYTIYSPPTHDPDTVEHRKL
jgi:mannose-6-phosphate isomerase-like protein (cupin superfamily)